MPLMERTIENGFELTGPVARGDWETVDRHREALRGSGFEQAYDALVEVTRRVRVVRTIAELDLPRHGVVGLVPTMGALHAGHSALFRAARPECDVLVASLFVNPTQFSESADLAAYPRDPEGDAALAEAEGSRRPLRAERRRRCTRPASQRGSSPAGAAEGLESEHRPEHFRGVATVCLKLLNIVRPQIAWFGRKDAQQVAVVKQLVRDLNLDVEIRVVDTVRDDDGLALSSRNELLSPDGARAGARDPARARDPRRRPARGVLADAGLEPDYVEVADLDGPTLAIAARVGSVRLIDNIPLPEGEHS